MWGDGGRDGWSGRGSPLRRLKRDWGGDEIDNGMVNE